MLALGAAHFGDYGKLSGTPSQPRGKPAGVTIATLDQAIDQYIEGYAYDAYRNVFERSNFAVNPPPQPEPVKVVEPSPLPPPPPPKPKPRPFKANLEVTGIVITPESKLVMVWDKTRKETQVLGESERLYRWKVVSIDSERVVLRHDLGGRYEFVVNEDTLIDMEN